jgi:hypothetical protein
MAKATEEKVEAQKREEEPKVAKQPERRNARFELSKRPVARCGLK